MNRIEIEAAIERAVKQHPERHNPRADTSLCEYTSPDDDDWHCIIGQVATDLGWTIPGPEIVLPAHEAALVLGWPVDKETANWLTDVQDQFDSDDLDWKTAFKNCYVRGLLNSTIED
jgi:hypothetical protein